MVSQSNPERGPLFISLLRRGFIKG